MHVCSKCDLSSDKKIGMLVNAGDDLSVFEKYDLLGVVCIKSRLGIESPIGDVVDGVWEGIQAIATGSGRRSDLR